jgi:hypothetical protein
MQYTPPLTDQMSVERFVLEVEVLVELDDHIHAPKSAFGNTLCNALSILFPKILRPRRCVL